MVLLLKRSCRKVRAHQGSVTLSGLQALDVVAFSSYTGTFGCQGPARIGHKSVGLEITVPGLGQVGGEQSEAENPPGVRGCTAGLGADGPQSYRLDSGGAGGPQGGSRSKSGETASEGTTRLGPNPYGVIHKERWSCLRSPGEPRQCDAGSPEGATYEEQITACGEAPHT